MKIAMTIMTLSACMPLLCLHSQVYAHDTTKTHPRISKKANELIEGIDQTNSAYQELYKKDSGGVVPLYWGKDEDPLLENYTGYDELNVIDGVVQEDTPVLRVLNHFYHAVTEDKLLIPVLLIPSDPHRSSKQAGIYNFNVAVDFYGYTEASKQLGYFWFGRSMHHVQDMTSPAHVHNDAHLTVFESEHDDYEGHYVPDNRNPDGATINFNGVSIRNVDAFSDIWSTQNSLARFIYDSVLYQGDLDFPLAGTPPAPSGELADMFPAGDLHFEDGVLGFNPYWQINSVGSFHYQLSFLSSDDWWDAPEFGGPAGYFYIEQTIPDTGVAVVPATIRSSFPVPFSATNPYSPAAMNGNIKSLVKLYSEHLIVPSVEYSAGFATWWYDIVNTPPYLKKIIVEQDSTIAYQAEWQDKINTRVNPSVVDNFIEGNGWVHDVVIKREFVRDPLQIQFMNALSSITIDLEFNEPVKSDSIELEVDGVNIIAGVAPPVEAPQNVGTVDAEKRWIFTIPAEKFNNFNGELVLTVRAQDKNNHWNNVGSELDGTPETPARRQAPSSYNDEVPTYPWHTNLTVGVNGEVGSNAYGFVDGDQSHILRFDTKSPVVNFNVQMN